MPENRFKIGDRVRCTHGENVIVGVIEQVVGVPQIRTEGAGAWHFPLQQPFTVEVLAAAEPPVGTVVIDVDGDAWQLVRVGQWARAGSDHDRCRSLAWLEDSYGPITFLEPVSA